VVALEPERITPGGQGRGLMNFDRVAGWYSAIEFLTAGSLIQQCRIAHLNTLRDCERILILGEGNGRFLEALMTVNPTASVEVIESSRKMIQLAQQRLTRSGFPLENIHFTLKDVRDWLPEKQVYDAIVSHFFLDCFTRPELECLVPHLATAASEDCVWLQSDFTVPAGTFRRIRAQLILWTMYRFFRSSVSLSADKLSNPSEMLRSGGFELEARTNRSWGLLNCDLWIKSSHSPV
jgi:2-polyprenyl-3-methyl-5-hydroxy-6-metoxy-1,4-benzoquinol methylase